MSLESVKKHLEESAPDLEIIISQSSTATVQMAAHGLSVSIAEIAKILALRVEDRRILVVLAGDKKLDNSKFRVQFGNKPRMLDLDETVELTGHPVGGVCPVGLKEKTEVFCDISLQRFEYIYPAAGSVHSAVKVSPQRMLEVSMGQWVDVSK